MGLTEYLALVPPALDGIPALPVKNGVFYSPTIAKEFTSDFGLQTINIELVGIDHGMYFLGPDHVQSDPDKAILNNRANDFIALMSEAALRGGSKLENELLNFATEIKTDPNKPLVKTYVVDLRD